MAATTDKPYTIDIPGLRDIFVARGVQNPATYKQRIELLRTRHSPLPNALGWLPNWIAHLDDTRQVLETAAPVVGWLAEAFPEAGIPIFAVYEGVTEMLHAGVAVLSGLAGAGGAKQTWFGATKPFARNWKSRLEDAGNLNHGAIFNTAVKAALRVSARELGYGINMGPLFAYMSDLVWGGIRAAEGFPVIVRLPPSTDPATQAAHWLFGHTAGAFLKEGLSTDDVKSLVVAEHLAVRQITSGPPPANWIARQSLIAAEAIPALMPTENGATQALTDAGVNLAGHIYPATPDGPHGPTWQNYADSSWADRGNATDLIQNTLAADPNRDGYQRLHDDAGLAMWSWATGIPDPFKILYPDELIAIGEAIGAGVWPPQLAIWALKIDTTQYQLNPNPPPHPLARVWTTPENLRRAGDARIYPPLDGPQLASWARWMFARHRVSPINSAWGWDALYAAIATWGWLGTDNLGEEIQLGTEWHRTISALGNIWTVAVPTPPDDLFLGGGNPGDLNWTDPNPPTYTS